MTAASDEAGQGWAEATDADKLPDEYPPERPLGADEYGTTAQEQRIGEPIAERVRREERRPRQDAGGVGPLLAPDEGTRLDEEPDEVADAPAPPGVGALPEGDVASGDPITRDAATEREAPPPAEEDAVHLAPDPPYHEGDSYLEGTTRERPRRR